MKNKLLNILTFSMLGFLLLACGSDRGNSTKGSAVAGVVELVADTDGDGIPNTVDSDIDGDGVVDNGTDTDGDGIIDVADVDVNGDGIADNGVDFDGDGINNAYDPDDDNDGLLDDRDPNDNNYDIDGDGIPDSVDVDIDGDGIADNGIDSDGDGITDGADVDVDGDGVPDNGIDTDGDGINDNNDVIDNNADNDNDGFPDALDPNDNNADIDGDGIADGADADVNGDGIVDNGIDTDRDGINDLHDIDKDGDGQVNIKELECADKGDPLDPSKRCPYIFETMEGEALVVAGFVYVPGGFDVDGDGTDEKGFWTTQYQARSTEVAIASADIISTVGSYSAFVANNFSIANSTENLQGYTNAFLTDTLKGTKLSFVTSYAVTKSRVSSLSPYLALASLSKLELRDSSNAVVSKSFKLLSHKQYVHIQKLLAADASNGGDGHTIRNNLLGIDKELSITSTSSKVYELELNSKEYLSELIWLVDSTKTVRFDLEHIKDWWGIDTDIMQYHNSGENGANSTLDVGMGVGIYKDNYAVVVRGGSLLYLLQGTTGVESDSPQSSKRVGFRAATAYLP